MFIPRGCSSTCLKKTQQNRVQGPEHLMNVGLHVAELSAQSTGNQLCVVCSKKFNKHVKEFPDMPYSERPVKSGKTKFCCQNVDNTYV